MNTKALALCFALAGAPAPAAPAPSAQEGPPEDAPAAAGAWYQVFFTTPRYPDKREYHTGGMDARLVAFIDSATKTVDMADYDFDLSNVASALARASARGVRMVATTFHPCSRKWWAVARPYPEEQPVMRMVFMGREARTAGQDDL